MSQKLYLRLYVALLFSTLVCLSAGWVAFRVLAEPQGPPGERMHHAAAVLRTALRDVPDAELPEYLRALSTDYGVELTAWDREGRVIASTLARAPRAPRNPGPRIVRERNGALELVTAIDGERMVGVRTHARALWPRRSPLLLALVALAVIMAIGSYPVARGLTKRLETLAAGVARWGAGDLAHRVEVEGHDEVAILAATFNRAAAQVDALVAQQRDTLANASHELRSPLARLQMALALCADEASAERREQLLEDAQKDIVDLDALIEDLLLMARADARTPRRPLEPVPLRALLGEEAERVHASVSGPELSILGDPLLLRHLVRNLLENAARYGAGKPIAAELHENNERVTLAVEDEGPGIPESERERIFAPFYRIPGAERAAAGTGVGLSLVRQVARYHGGEARALSRAGGGSRFEVELPRRGAG